MAKNFRYTLESSVLTLDQRQFYEDNGYLLVKNTVDLNVLDECSTRFKEFCDGKRKITKTMKLMRELSHDNTDENGEFLYCKLQDISWDDVFEKYFMSPKLLDYVQCFVGPNITLVSSMLINKLSEKETSKPLPHQNLHNFPFRPINRTVSTWTAMQNVDERNGCLFVIPGTHKCQLFEHRPHNLEGDVDNKAVEGISGFDLIPSVKLCMEKGDTVFYHPLLVHRFGLNLTTGTRKAITGHYAGSKYQRDEVKETSKEQNLSAEPELSDMGRILGFKIKSRKNSDPRTRVVRKSERSKL